MWSTFRFLRAENLMMLILLLALTASDSKSQSYDWNIDQMMQFEPSPAYPFGQANPKGSEAMKDFDPMIGICHCKSLQYAGGVAQDTVLLVWEWKYILNGMGVQDRGWFGTDSLQSAFTSIRILNPETQKWHVPFFVPSMNRNPQIWIGGKEGDKVILKQSIIGNDGSELESVLTFSNMTDYGYDWTGKIYNPSTQSENVFWRIWCRK